MVTLYTIGHSTRGIDEFIALLAREGIRSLVDVRTFPASRRYPHFNREALADSLATRDIAYSHAPALGGRRRPRPDSPNVSWRNDGFRGYADHIATPEFRAALDELLIGAAQRPTTVMCSEAVPWRCHRTMIADAALARGARPLHVLDARTSPHTLTKFARIDRGEVRYDAAPAEQGALFGQSAASDSR